MSDLSPPLSAGGEGEAPAKFPKRGGGLTGSQILEEGCWEREGDFFQGEGAVFTKKIN